MRKTEEENRTRESIDEKPPELDEEMWEENWKIIDIINEKNLPTLINDREGKTEGVWWEEGLWSRRDLVGIRCYSILSRVELQMVKPPNSGSLTLSTSGRQISSHLPASGSIEN